jgi:hypothetical protein
MMTPTEQQEALSAAYSESGIIIVPLPRAGGWAVFNVARTLCGVVTSLDVVTTVWFPPDKRPTGRRPTLEELGL